MNTFLKLNLTDSSACSFCYHDIETIEHLFLDWFHVKEIWLRTTWKNYLEASLISNHMLFGKFKYRHIYYRLQECK